MRQSKHDDVNLAEVKAVLGRLQQISLKPQAGDDGSASSGPAAPAGGDVPAAASRLVKAGILIVPVVAVVAGIAIFSGHNGDGRLTPAPPAPVKGPENLAFRENPTVRESPTVRENPIVRESPTTRESPMVQAKAKPNAPAEEIQKSPADAALSAASELLVSGQVQAARDALLRVTKENSADVAWALARSYDPNFLIEVPAADASPDVTEATRWYRTWYSIAVKQGLVADSISLERIIRSMN